MKTYSVAPHDLPMPLREIAHSCMKRSRFCSNLIDNIFNINSILMNIKPSSLALHDLPLPF